MYEWEFVGEEVEGRGEEKRGEEEEGGGKVMIGSVDVFTSKSKKYPINVIFLVESMLNRERNNQLVNHERKHWNGNCVVRVDLVSI